MSLFPAYDPGTSKAGVNTPIVSRHLHPNEAKQEDDSDLSWLKNTSYSAEATVKNVETKHSLIKDERSLLESKHGRDHSKSKKKKKSDKKERTSRHKNVSPLPSKYLEDERFYEDKKQEKGNFLVDTLYRPAIPRYDKYNDYFKVYKLMKKKLKKDKKPKRYYLMESGKSEFCFKSNEEPFSKEEELTKITEGFNKKLTENPRNIEVWLDYIRFQNTVLEFEKTYRSSGGGGGGVGGGARVTWERQLAILERALQSNPASEQLLAMRLQLLENISSPDQVADECTRALVQDPGCVPLWRTLVRTCRNNMGRCVAPAVLQVFSKALSRLGQLRVHRPPATIDRDILALVLECGLFLQQAGLWEQLMTLVQMYLSLNLTATGQFALPEQPSEDKLREQEDLVLSSGLPLSVLWLRVEKLRAAHHYLPLADCESDPQRVVFTQDLAGLLQPVMGGDMRLQLVATVFTLLKVPVLPTRHTTLECLGLLQIPSAINNIETLLAAVYPNGFSSLSDCSYLSGSVELVSEPQYVREAAGRAEFLSTVVTLLQHCADLLPAPEAVVVHVWLLRLYALLCRLHSLLPGVATVGKLARSHAKQLLKKAQYRDNLMLYSEYAMIERAAGDLDRACGVLETAAALPHHATDSSQPPDVHRLTLCRRLAECLLLKDYTANKSAAVKVLSSVEPSDTRWQQLATATVDRFTPSAKDSVTLRAALEPQPLVECLKCHALYLFLTCSVWDATAMLERHIDNIPDDPATMGAVWVEQLYEELTGLLYLHTILTKTGFATLRSSLVKALEAFPNNLNLLNTLACLETSGGGGGSPMWKLVSYFPRSQPLARMVLVFVVRHRISLYSEGGHYLRSLLQRLCAEEQTAQCPLAWRLYLQLVAAQEAGAPVKATFYKALHACPWVKALYLDAVKFLPEELPEVQDLLIEKELRIHTTPEELEILRD